MNSRLKWVLFVSLAVGSVFAQTEKTTLRGTVTDPSGAVVTGATVAVVDVATNIEVRRVTTDNSGNYEAPDLKPSIYRVTVDLAGFRKFLADDVQLDPGQVRRVDAKLSVGSTAETITVNAGAALIQTETGTISGELDTKKLYSSTPTVDIYPSPLSLLTLTPGIQGNGWAMVMAGIPVRNLQTWAMDGVANDTTGDQNDNPNFFETVEVTAVNAGTDTARAANFNMVSKHGANGFHGSLYWKEENSALNARKFFDPRNTPFIQHEGEVEAGGHIIKDRTFFFVAWQHQMMPLGSWNIVNVPTVAMRTGDFSQFLNAATAPNNKVAIIKDPATGNPCPNNQIPQSQISSVAQKFLNYYPLPNVGGPTTYSQNYGWMHPYNYDDYKGDWPFLRIDHKVTERNNLYVRWMARETPYIWAAGVSEQFDYTQARDHRGTVASDTWVLSNTLVNSFTFGHTTDLIKYGEPEQSVTPLFGDDVVKAVGLQGVNAQGFHTLGFPNVSISGVGSVSTLANTNGCLTDNICTNDGINTFEDTATWSKGRHILKFGAEYRHFWQYLGSVSSSVYGSYSFAGTYTGSGFADFLLGIPSSTSRLSNPLIGRSVHQNQTGSFVGDTFKVTSRLTLDYGLRWDYYGSPLYNDGFMYNWDPVSGNIIVPKGTLGKISPLFPTSIIPVVEGSVVPSPKLTNFHPRFSAAYRISDKLVVRGGYGEFTESWGYNSSGRVNGAGPFQLSESYSNVLTNGTPLFAFPNAFPTSLALSAVPSQSVTAIPMHTDEGVLRQYNATLERQIGNLGLRASFLGMNGSGLNYSLNVNKPQASTIPFTVARRPYPNVNSATEYRNDGSWHRQALQLQAQRRAGPVTFDSSFTLANNMENYYLTQDPYNVTDNWERDGNERRKYFVTSGTWALPVGKGRHFLPNAHPVVNGVLGGWDAQAIVTLASGQYTSPSFTGPDPANASSGNVTQYPDCVGSPYSGTRSISGYYNLAAFAVPASNYGRYGNCGMNVLETYPMHVGHLSLLKTFGISERIKATFIAQISNITNTPHFQSVNTNITQANFGAFTSVFPYYQPERQGYRQMDLKLRIQW